MHYTIEVLVAVVGKHRYNATLSLRHEYCMELGAPKLTAIILEYSML